MAEIHYKNGDKFEKITYKDVGAAPADHTHSVTGDYLPLTGGTLTGTTTIHSANVNYETKPSANQHGIQLQFTGSAYNDKFGFIRCYHASDGYRGLSYSVTRVKDGKTLFHGLDMSINGAGKRWISVADKGVWRNITGLGTGTGALPIANGGTGGTTKATARSGIGITSGTSAAPASGTAGDIYIQYA